MSLQDVYKLAHSAECRLNISASRPDRNLRYVVGHLMHYESLRLRIVEIEHDIGRSQRAGAVHFAGDHQLRRQPSSGQLGKRSPPPDNKINAYDDIDDDDIEDEDMFDDEDDIEPDEDGDEDLGLTRFPSGRPPPLVRDTTEDDDDDDEPHSPEDPDPTTLHDAMKRPSDEELAQNLEKVRKCACHGHTKAPAIQQLWVLPRKDDDPAGITRAVAEVAA